MRSVVTPLIIVLGLAHGFVATAGELSASGSLGAAQLGQGMLVRPDGSSELRLQIADVRGPKPSPTRTTDAWSYAQHQTVAEELALLKSEFAFAASFIIGTASADDARQRIQESRYTGSTLYLVWTQLDNALQADAFPLTGSAKRTLDKLEKRVFGGTSGQLTQDQQRLSALEDTFGTAYVASVTNGSRLAVFCRIEGAEKSVREKAAKGVALGLGLFGASVNFSARDASETAAAMASVTLNVVAQITAGEAKEATLDSKGTPISTSPVSSLRNLEQVQKFLDRIAERHIVLTPGVAVLEHRPLAGLLVGDYPNLARSLSNAERLRPPHARIEIQGTDFDRTTSRGYNAEDKAPYGEGVVSSVGEVETHLEYLIDAPRGGRYELYTEYADNGAPPGHPRPTKIYI